MTLLSAGIINANENPVPTDSLEAWYPLTPETVTSSVAKDQSGNGNDIARHGVTMGPGGATFDGTDDYFGAENFGSITNQAITVAFWADQFDSGAYLSISDEGTPNALKVSARFETVIIHGTEFNFPLISATDDTHVIVKADTSGHWEIKIDNSTTASGGYSGSFSGGLYFVSGADTDSPQGGSIDGFYSGTMHDVVVYSKATSDAEDTQLYNNPST